MRQRLAGPDPARAQPALRHRGRGHRVLRPGRDRRRQVDALGRPAEHLRRRRGRLRTLAVGQRRRPVRARGAPSGNITPAEFLKLNATVGSWKEVEGHGPGGLPVHRGALLRTRRSSTRGAGATCGSAPTAASTPAPRRAGNMEAANAAYTSGHRLPRRDRHPDHRLAALPRDRLDMHNSHQSFASRKRMLNLDGDASNQVIWFTDARPARAFDQTPLAFAVIDEWLANMRSEAVPRRRGQQARGAVDSCFATNGSLLALGRGRVGRHPRLSAGGRVHAGVPALLDLADRRGRADRGRRLQVRPEAGRDGARRRHVRTVAAERGGRRPARSRSSRPGSATTRSPTSAGRG